MKIHIKYSLIGLGLLSSVSCVDTLDTNPSESYDDATVWGSKSTAMAFVNSTYETVVASYYAGSGSCTSWESLTPNSALCSQVGDNMGSINTTATETGISNESNYGPNRAGVLRSCNLIIHRVEESSTISDGDKPELIAHGRFLRGLVFFDQARKMGRFIPIMDVLSSTDTVAARIPMTKDVAESYRYVMADLRAAARDLPETAEPGLPTKWAANVILSRAALQAYAYTKDRSYIELADSAASEAINNSGVQLSTSTGMFNETDEYNSEILWGYYRLRSNTIIGSYQELICTYPNISADDVTNSNSPTALRNPNGRTFEGWGVYWPTQDLVDQFLVTDEATGEALPWYETSQYKENVTSNDPSTLTEAGQVDQYNQVRGDARRIPTPQDFQQVRENFPNFTRYDVLKPGATRNLTELMYEGRDRRFYTAVVYDSCQWIGETVTTNLGGNASAGVRDREDGGWYNTATGYYWRKSNIENPDPRAYYNCLVALHYNLARLGEAYLNLAEAKLLEGDVPAAVTALNATRTTHGGLAPSKATTEEQAWADYIRERNCELTHEGGDLYFSYLRWGKYGGYANHGREAGDVVYDLDRPVHKIEISRDRSKLVVGQLTLLNSATRTFTTRRYLFPIQQAFLNTREAYGLDHQQNEGW